MYITAILAVTYILFGIAHSDSSCLTESDFHSILRRWVSLFNQIDAKVAKGVATADITLWSDSADFLFGAAPGSITGVPTFGNRSALIQGLRSSQAGTASSSHDNRFYALRYPNHQREASYGCDSITYHWRFDGKSNGNIPGSTNKRGAHVGVGGIHYLLIENRVKKIKRVYEEFNVGEQLFTGGTFVCFQKHNESRCSGV